MKLPTLYPLAGSLSAGGVSAMSLQDRIRRWWSPAQWADDHPSQATESPQGENKHWWQGGGWFFRLDASDALDNIGPSGSSTNIERDFKKPR